MEHIYKNLYPFMQMNDEEWHESSMFEPFLPYYVKTYETINEIKTKGNLQDIIDNILPFMKYLKSLDNIRKNDVKTKYQIGLITTYDDGEEEERCIWYGYFTYIYNGSNIILVNDEEHDNQHPFPLPDKYFKIELTVYHYYDYIKILKELDNCPRNAYKIDQCVRCLTNSSNILYNPCLHVCVCSQCDDEGKFKKCPYCREKIEEIIIIKKN